MSVASWPGSVALPRHIDRLAGKSNSWPFCSCTYFTQPSKKSERRRVERGGQQQHPRRPPSGVLFSQESFYFQSHFAAGTAVSFGGWRPLLNLKVKRHLQRTGQLDSPKTFRLRLFFLHPHHVPCKKPSAGTGHPPTSPTSNLTAASPFQIDARHLNRMFYQIPPCGCVFAAGQLILIGLSAERPLQCLPCCCPRTGSRLTRWHLFLQAPGRRVGCAHCH